MEADEHRVCHVERLYSGDWSVTFPDGLTGFYATEARARGAAERWELTGRRIDGVSRLDTPPERPN